VPVAICTDNTTVSATDQVKENLLASTNLNLDDLATIHRRARRASFIADLDA